MYRIVEVVDDIVEPHDGVQFEGSDEWFPSGEAWVNEHGFVCARGHVEPQAFERCTPAVPKFVRYHE